MIKNAATQERTISETRSRVSGENSKQRLLGTIFDFASRQYLLGILVLLCIGVGILKPAFWSGGNLSNVLFQATFVGLAACGMTLLIAGGILDLSVGGVIAVSSIAVAMVLPFTPFGSALVLALVIVGILRFLSV